LVGCLAAEMPASYHLEALKAQAVAIQTYAQYNTKILGKTALTDSPLSDQAYIAQAQRKEKWGDNFENYEKKMQQAATAVCGQIMTYEDKPILAAYHAVNGGQSESAAVYWGEEIPYLVSVKSPGDTLSADGTKTVVFTPAEMEKAFEGVKGVTFGESKSKWFGKPETSAAGTVTQISVGGQKCTGQQVREILGLRSANFSITYTDAAFRITVKGHGHGVGMSQYGADFMARQGDDYKAILAHYYTGVKLNAA
jgi:stage II sporulation protein D